LGLKPHSSNVAFWAHVGGFVAGALISIAVYNYIPKARPYPSRTDHRD
jgi:membrane associated rhomboid family serine protease